MQLDIIISFSDVMLILQGFRKILVCRPFNFASDVCPAQYPGAETVIQIIIEFQVRISVQHYLDHTDSAQPFLLF